MSTFNYQGPSGGWAGAWDTARLHKAAVVAARRGVEATMAQAVTAAKPLYYPGHGLRTSALQGSIKFLPANVSGDTIIGTWGSFDIKYAGYVEGGTRFMEAQHQLAEAAGKTYGNLGKNIKHYWQEAIRAGVAA